MRCRSIHYNLFETEWKIIEVQTIWSAALNYEIEHHIFENAFKALWKMTPDSYLINIQYKILYQRVATNDILLKMGIKPNHLCNLCNELKETNLHAFLECKYIKSFWLEIENWMSIIRNCRIRLDQIQKIFGDRDLNFEVNLIILVAKKTIYKCRLKGKIPCCNMTKSDVKQ